MIVENAMPKLVFTWNPFEWPCDRRDAHGPHVDETFVELQGRDVTVPARLVHDCRGVRAHPATMIGGAYR